MRGVKGRQAHRRAPARCATMTPYAPELPIVSNLICMSKPSLRAIVNAEERERTERRHTNAEEGRAFGVTT